MKSDIRTLRCSSKPLRNRPAAARGNHLANHQDTRCNRDNCSPVLFAVSVLHASRTFFIIRTSECKTRWEIEFSENTQSRYRYRFRQNPNVVSNTVERCVKAIVLIRPRAGKGSVYIKITVRMPHLACRPRHYSIFYPGRPSLQGRSRLVKRPPG